MLLDLESLIYSGAAVLLAAVLYLCVQWLVAPLAVRMTQKTYTQWDDLILTRGFITRLSAVILLGALLAYANGVESARLLNSVWGVRVIQALLVLASGWLVAYVLGKVVLLYESSRFKRGVSIKGYAQLGKIVIYLFTILLGFAVLTGQQLGYYLTGLGAVLAVVLLVFRDTILSFVATLQIHNSGTIRVGDWIEVPEYEVDGEVIDIELHTVKVENWNKTISTVPTFKIVNTPLKNWRGMERSGGRRIKRAIHIDMSSIRFLTDAEQEHFLRFKPLRSYMTGKRAEIERHNAAQAGEAGELGDLRRLTNVGTFRAYVLSYLKTHPLLNTRRFTCLVRQHSPGPSGLPLEIYVFTGTTEWIPYETIQADIFDHLLATLSEFDLRPYQHGLLEGIARQGVQLYSAPERQG